MSGTDRKFQVRGESGGSREKTLLELAAEERRESCIDHIISSKRMDDDWSHVTEKILNLTLKIIYLLTGESFPPEKFANQVTITVPPPNSMKPERHNMEKILEVTKKMMELLTGEVPIRCQDVTVYFSMEELEYLEGHKDLYKDVMMDNQPPLTSPDGSSNGNPPERCLHPLYSRDSTQEDHTIPHHHQSENLRDSKVEVKEEIKEEGDEDGVMEDNNKDVYQDTMVESSSYRNPPERCPRPLYSRNSTQEGHIIPHHHQCENLWDYNIVVKEEYKVEDEEYGVMEELSGGHKDMLEPPNTRNPPERCPRPCVESREYREGHTIPHHHQGEDLMNMKVEGEVEETYVRDHQQYTEEAGMMRTFIEEDTPTEISTGHAMEKPSKDRLTLSPGCKMEDEDITGDCGGEKTMSSTMDGGLHSVDGPSNPSDSEQPRTHTDEKRHLTCPECGESFLHKYRLAVHQRSHTGKKIYSCPECEKCFLSKSDLVLHQRSHTGEKPYSCSKCGIYFSQKSSLSAHLRRHVGEEMIYSCPECGESFRYKKDLAVHQRSHPGKGLHSCPECGKSFPQKFKLMRHQKCHEEKKYSCSECGKSFLQNSHLTEHKLRHTGQRLYSCSECGKSFVCKSDLTKHERSHKGAKPKSYTCAECGKGFSHKTNLNVHLKYHTGEKPHSCSECGKCFVSKLNLDAHLRSHTGEKPYGCPECGKRYSWKSTLVIHQKTHAGGDGSFSCSECGKRYQLKAQLAIHQRTHTGVKPYSCSKCGKHFMTHSHLARHQVAHAKEKLFSCSECGKSYLDKCNLVVHQRSHTGERPYACSECEKRFLCKSHLTKHQRSHTGEKPYSCTECGKCFRKKPQLARHEGFHTGEKPYSCAECGKYFLRKSDLTKHERSHAEEKPYTCSECGKCFERKPQLVRHGRSHTGEKPDPFYSCRECGESFSRKYRLAVHKRSHTGEKLHSCPECGKCFLYKSDLETHQRSHKGEKPYSCADDMSPPRKVLETVAKLDRFRHKDKDGQGEDGGPSASGMETSTPQTSKVLEAISTCQATLTTKIEEVKVDISLIRQDLHKLRDRVSEAEHRLSHAEVAIPPLQASPDQASHHIAQLQLKQDDLENRMRSNNLHFISFPEDNSPLSICRETSIDHMATSIRMEEDQSHMTEKILNLTLEIIYLLTGERFPMTITVPPCDSLKPERHNMQKILEVTKKMMELLTGEVPIRCQDVTVYFSMEEWEYLEGHKDLYKDVMMDNQPPLTSPDGSSNGNPPERCPRPLYSRDSTQEGHTIPHHHQSGNFGDYNIIVKEEYIEEDEEYGVVKELYKGRKDLYKDIMMESPNKRNPPERCPRPLYSRDSTQEGHTIPHHHQGEDLIIIKVEDEVEETYVRDTEEAGMTRTFIEEDTPTEISTGHTIKKSSKNHLSSSLDYTLEDEDCVWEKTMDGGLHSVDRPSNSSDFEQPRSLRDGAGIQGGNTFSCSECGESFGSELSLSLHQRFHSGENLHSCPECGKFFLHKSALLRHEGSHKGEKPHSCDECGKCFSRKSNLSAHQRLHTGEELHSCPECGKCFPQKSILAAHQRLHTGEALHSCPECGKGFLHKSQLVTHWMSHTGEKPYSCSECGKGFSRKSNYSAHQRCHTKEKPFSCSECDKCFVYKIDLTIHQRSHTGEKPFSCPDCGKCFLRKSNLAVHLKYHRGEKPHSCSECGKSFLWKADLERHMRIHTGEKPYSCHECGKCFTQKTHLFNHFKSHVTLKAKLAP
ncbi:uncharacterized protein [Aquarana catesbeiana]|uniref:uncharacterized protein n=1 Tax=Aquarana catesbeiana TaxID=8400 RepID=UPI003CCA2D70